eukprot:1134317-Pelagomonas_calceolata.AAC.1
MCTSCSPCAWPSSVALLLCSDSSQVPSPSPSHPTSTQCLSRSTTALAAASACAWLASRGSSGASKQTAASPAVVRWREATRRRHKCSTVATCSARPNTCRLPKQEGWAVLRKPLRQVREEALRRERVWRGGSWTKQITRTSTLACESGVAAQQQQHAQLGGAPHDVRITAAGDLERLAHEAIDVAAHERQGTLLVPAQAHTRQHVCRTALDMSWCVGAHKLFQTHLHSLQREDNEEQKGMNKL